MSDFVSACACVCVCARTCGRVFVHVLVHLRVESVSALSCVMQKMPTRKYYALLS